MIKTCASAGRAHGHCRGKPGTRNSAEAHRCWFRAHQRSASLRQADLLREPRQQRLWGRRELSQHECQNLKPELEPSLIILRMHGKQKTSIHAASNLPAALTTHPMLHAAIVAQHVS